MPVIAATIALALIAATPAAPCPPPRDGGGRLIVLADTGARRDDLPLVEPHPDPRRYLEELTRGFSGRLLRLYPMAQRFGRPDRPPQPAYLVLSRNQGGFPRVGFHLGGQPRADTAFVDLHRNGDLTNRFGAMNQIYPHELMHLIVRDLAGPLTGRRDNQIHAIGVRTDRAIAFSEGFAEHVQIMAVDAPGVAAETAALPHDPSILAEATARVDAYRRTLSARWAIAPRWRMTLPFWFSRTEQVLRYHAIRANAFARDASIPERLYDGDSFSAYLLESVLPGNATGRPRSPARLVATEGAVSALFYRLVMSDTLRSQYRDEAFYQAFGARRSEVDPVDNVYLKLFAAIRDGGYDTVAVLDAYVRLFPEDAAAVSTIVRDTLLGGDLPRSPQLWMRNAALQTGTSIFDQYRGLPRAHTFDLNAASPVDLLTVPGVTRELAAAMQRRAPFASVDDLNRVEGMDGSLVAAFHRMHQSYRDELQVPGPRASLSFRGVLMPYAWRAGAALLGCAVISALLYRAVRRVRWWRAALNGIATAVVGLAAGWMLDGGTGTLAWLGPLALLGAPAALIALWRSRSPRAALVVAAAWALSCVPPALAVAPLG